MRTERAWASSPSARARASIERQVFPAGREAEEIRALWQASHQKVLFDEIWLGRLLPDVGSAPVSKQVEEIAERLKRAKGYAVSGLPV